LSYGAQVGHPNGVQLRGGDQVDSGFVLPPGKYVISEMPPGGWETSVGIDDPSRDSSPSGGQAAIALAAGETVTVTFRNVATKGRILLVNLAKSEGTPAEVPFVLSYGASISYPQGVSLHDDEQLDSGFSLEPGTYTIDESVPAKWDPPAVTINDPSSDSSSSGSLATVALDAGETVTVTYTNYALMPGRIILVMHTSPDGAAESFGFTLSYGAQLGYPDGLSMRDGQQLDSGFTLPARTQFTIAEAPATGWQVSKIDVNASSASGGRSAAASTRDGS